MLEILLSISYSDVVLLNHIRRALTTKSTIKLLEHLAQLLKDCKFSGDVGTIQPDFGQLVDWISLILDAHHHELLIAGTDDQVKQLIKQLGQLVGESVSHWNSLSSIFFYVFIVLLFFAVRIPWFFGTVGALDHVTRTEAKTSREPTQRLVCHWSCETIVVNIYTKYIDLSFHLMLYSVCPVVICKKKRTRLNFLKFSVVDKDATFEPYLLAKLCIEKSVCNIPLQEHRDHSLWQ